MIVVIAVIVQCRMDNGSFEKMTEEGEEAEGERKKKARYSCRFKQYRENAKGNNIFGRLTRRSSYESTAIHGIVKSLGN